MLTFTTFALLALSLFTTFMAITAMRRERKELRHNCDLLDYVIELEKELTSLYEQRAERESLLVEKTQQIHDLQEKLFETKESSNFLLESYQEELDVAQDCIWDKEKQLSDKQEILNEVAAELFSLGFRDGIIKDVEVLRIRDLALEQNIPF